MADAALGHRTGYSIKSRAVLPRYSPPGTRRHARLQFEHTGEMTLIREAAAESDLGQR